MKCGIQMYYELGVVKKFQIPQEVGAGNTQGLPSWMGSRHCMAEVPMHALHSSWSGRRSGFTGACRERGVRPEPSHPTEGREHCLKVPGPYMQVWSRKVASSPLHCLLQLWVCCRVYTDGGYTMQKLVCPCCV